MFGDPPQSSERGAETKLITHERATRDWIEEVIVLEAMEHAPEHAVPKVTRPVVCRDDALMCKAETEMPGAKGDHLARPDQPVRDSGDRLFVRPCGACLM